MIAIGVWLKAFMGTFVGRAIAVSILALGALKLNNIYQRSVGETRGIAKVVKKSNEVAKTRNAEARKIRSSIKPSTAWKRLLSEYSGAD